MEQNQQCMYELAFIRARKRFIAYAVLAILIPVVGSALCYWLGKPTSWMGRSGAIMAGLAFLADLKARDMADVFKPSGYVGISFSATKKKYFSQVKIAQGISVLLILVGTALWGFGDLLPIGSQIH